MGTIKLVLSPEFKAKRLRNVINLMLTSNPDGIDRGELASFILAKFPDYTETEINTALDTIINAQQAMEESQLK